jgi:hypothetical protein
VPPPSVARAYPNDRRSTDAPCARSRHDAVGMLTQAWRQIILGHKINPDFPTLITGKTSSVNQYLAISIRIFHIYGKILIGEDVS